MSKVLGNQHNSNVKGEPGIRPASVCAHMIAYVCPITTAAAKGINRTLITVLGGVPLY